MVALGGSAHRSRALAQKIVRAITKVPRKSAGEVAAPVFEKLSRSEATFGEELPARTWGGGKDNRSGGQFASFE